MRVLKRHKIYMRYVDAYLCRYYVIITTKFQTPNRKEKHMHEKTLQQRILKVLDKILDFLTIEELARVSKVSRVFWLVASFDWLYFKFGIFPTETFIEESLWSQNISEIYSNPKISFKIESKKPKKQVCGV